MNKLSDKTINISEIKDIDEVVIIINAWHKKQLRQLEKFLEIPEGAKASLKKGPTVKLTGDKLEAFRIGLHTAISSLDKLPFEVSGVESKALH